MFYELLTGQKPFDGDTPIQIALKHVNERVPAPSLLQPGIPPALDTLVLRATAHNPDQRQRSAAELLEELTQIQIALDPKRSQLTLPLDLPPQTPTPKRKSTRPEVRIGSTLVTKVRSFTEPTHIKREEKKPNFVPEGKLEAPIPLPKKVATKRKTSKRVQRNRYIAFIILMLVVAGGLYQLAWPVNGISLPSVVGMNVADATSTLSNIGMKTVIAQKEFDQSIPKGRVISSAPGGGARLKQGGTVALTISEGAPTDPSPTPSAIPTPSATPTPTSSGAIAPITISNYVGLTSDQAQSELTAAGLKVNQSFAYSDSIATGSVITQTPDGAVPILPGSIVTIVVSQGTANVFVPNVYSLSGSAATRELENLQLKVVVRKIGNGKHVTNVSPKVGSAVKRGSTVIITLG
jgi:serine/threonine-protein kinase